MSVLLGSGKGMFFCLYFFLINELALEIAQNGMYGVQLEPDVVQMLIILFADDVLLASNCVPGML